MAAESACFLDSAGCGDCLAAVYSNAWDDTSRVLASPACAGANETALSTLVDAPCFDFPLCSYPKTRCEGGGGGCARCLGTLRAGNGRLAAAECSAGLNASLLAQVVNGCLGETALSCDFWRARCDALGGCGGCLDNVLGSGGPDDFSAIATTLSSELCSDARADNATRDALLLPMYYCPVSVSSACRTLVASCVLMDPACESCLVDAAAATTPECVFLLSKARFGISDACAGCPESVSEINRLAAVTAFVGVVSMIACLSVVAVIFAHGRDLVSMRDRIIVGMMMSNALYSSANAIPMYRLKTGVTTCGRFVLSFKLLRFGRSWWFLGKFGLVGFEIFILAASIAALRRGARAVSPRAEAALHLACVACGVAAFAAFYIRAGQIDGSGLDESTQNEAQSDAFEHIGDADDFDDDLPGTRASDRFESASVRYNELVEAFLRVWLGLLGLAVAMWASLRYAYSRALQSWRSVAERVKAEEAADEWALTRRSLWRARHELVDMQKEGYTEVVAPLEPYIAVFTLFGAPAVVMAVDSCASDSVVRAGFGGEGPSNGDITRGPCYAVCELVLSFRSLAAVVVYCLSRDRRRELADVPGTCRLLCARLRGRWRRPSWQRLDSGVSMELTALKAGSGDDDAGWRVDDSEVRLEKRLAEGSFGVVWSARLREGSGFVAVKLFKQPLVSDGDGADPLADEEFAKECEVLKLVKHTNLLRFHGCGATSEGCGFIVTELMSGGSLHDVLRDRARCRVLLWLVRKGIVADVASGMEHLHAIPIVHRDLKSANVLVDERLSVAKVADFGSGRRFRVRRPKVVVSAFTGVARAAPLGAMGENGARGEHSCGGGVGGGTVRLDTLSAAVVDARGVMTRAVGTLLWMAPEMYRGDTAYGPEVDVYSFGIVMWEVATRAMPWDELGEDLSYLEFTTVLTAALQAGRRPSVPEEVAAEHACFVAVMRRCWASDAAERPSFKEVVEALSLADDNSAQEVRDGGGGGGGGVGGNGGTLTQPLLDNAW